jgi:hypothetical protein
MEQDKDKQTKEKTQHNTTLKTKKMSNTDPPPNNPDVTHVLLTKAKQLS